ncbi:hypothetical protein BGX29_002980 [Mortierella sp. GBA35]|nr:hypothetical protein BGX29_002980 [Mortierella sp. GBA35]
MSRLWNLFGMGRNNNRMASLTTGSSSTSSTCLRLFSRRRRRTLHKWVWITSLILVMTLGIYIAIIGVSRIHGYLADGGAGVSVGLDADDTKTTAMRQDAPGTTIPPAAGQDKATSGRIWKRRAENDMDDRLDFYPDEDEDDPSEAASFLSWLAQASLITPNSMQQQRSQQYQEDNFHEPPPPSRLRVNQTSSPSVLEPERYFTYMPFAGISDQFYGMLRAMSIARALDRTLIIPPSTSSSHDKSRQNQVWSEFFDPDEFRRRTGLKMVEYQDLRDRGSFRGPTGIQESGSAVGASWVPPWVKESNLRSSKDKGGNNRYQHGLGTGTAVVDMTMPCHVTCGFGSKRDLDFTAKAFVRQWEFQYKKAMLPESSSPPVVSPATLADSSNPLVPTVDNSSIDQTRDFDRIVGALQDDSLKAEIFLCVSNTYKIQISPAAIPASSLINSIEWHEFGQHLLFQPRLTQFVDEFLDRTFGEHPVERVKYGNDTFWIPPTPYPGLLFRRWQW